MFLWTGVLDRPAYAVRVALVIALLAITNVIVPPLCQGRTDLFCTIAPFPLAPDIWILAFLISLSICMRRARDTGLRPWIGAIPPLILLGDRGWLVFANFGNSIVPFTPVGIALMAMLAVPKRDALRRAGDLFIDKTMLVLSIALAFIAVIAGVPGIDALATELVGLAFPRQFEAIYIFGLCVLFVTPVVVPLAAYRLWWRPPPPPESPAPANVPAAPDLWRPGLALSIGTAFAVPVVLWTLFPHGGEMESIVMTSLTFLFPAFAPNILIYTALAAALLRIKARRDALAIVFLVVTLIPFGLWIVSTCSVLWARAQERAIVAAIPKFALPATLRTVVIEGDDSSLVDCARRLILSADRNVSDILIPKGKTEYIRYAKPGSQSAVDDGQPADTVPAEHALVRLPTRPRYFNEHHVKVDAGSPPVEVYAVDPQGAHLAAASYTSERPLPDFPPVVMVIGWSPRNNWTPDAPCRNVEGFLRRELLDKLPRQPT